MTAIADLLNSAGPYAGWVAFALLVTAGLWAYSTDRIVSPGRHREQAAHYQQQIALMQQQHDAEVRDLRDRLEAQSEDKVYWRDTSLDLMSTVAASVGHGQ